MPIYEEKLISPFAIRFTQEHIRTTFRDGRAIEDTIAEIDCQPGVGDYDVILTAPFPHIEITRWRPKGPGTDGDHWFTLDNRRLYCLQRVAASYWPKTAAVVVQTLYTDAGSVWKKYDSSSYGRSVSIAHSLKGEEISRWNWYHEFRARELAKSECATAKIVLLDDDKGGIDDLLDTMEVPSTLLALARQLPLSPTNCGSQVRNSDESTAAPSLSEEAAAIPSKADREFGDKDSAGFGVSSLVSDEDSIMSELDRRFSHQSKTKTHGNGKTPSRSRTPSTAMEDSDTEDNITDHSMTSDSSIAAASWASHGLTRNQVKAHSMSNVAWGPGAAYGSYGTYNNELLMGMQMHQAALWAHAAHANYMAYNLHMAHMAQKREPFAAHSQLAHHRTYQSGARRK